MWWAGPSWSADPARPSELDFPQNATGAVAGPFDAWLTLRASRPWPSGWTGTAPTRQRVADMLASHPAVSEVFYPGLAAHPGHEIAAKQMRDFGGMVSFRARGGEAEAVEVCGRTRLFTPRRVARRRRVADRAPGPDDPRLGGRVPA